MGKKILIAFVFLFFIAVASIFVSATAWDLSTALFDNVNFSILAQTSTPKGMFINPDGIKMFIIADNVYQYTLSQAWNLSTASYDNINISKIDSFSEGISFKSDGTKMYLVGRTNDLVYQYTLSQAWNLSTASYDNINFSILTQDTTSEDIFFNPDGTKMYIDGDANNAIYQYSLSQAWNLSTASYDNINFSVTGQQSQPLGLFFSSAGTKMYVAGNVGDQVYQYSLSQAWNLSTASFDNVNFSVGTQDTTPQGIFFNASGTKMYMVGLGNKQVYQYSMSDVPADTCTAPSINNNWIINIADNCSSTSAINLGSGLILISGTNGKFNINSNSNITAHGKQITCSAVGCQMIINSGSKIILT